MRKIILTTVALVALCSPVFAQSDADMKKATDGFHTGMDNIVAALEKQRDAVCPGQSGETDKFICKIQFASAVATVSGIKFDQVKVEMNAKMGNKAGFEKAKQDLDKSFANLKVQLEQLSKWK